MASDGDPEVVQEGTPSSSEDGVAPSRPVAAGRLERLRSSAQHTRKVIEARRADSASIDTAFKAVERDAQSGGGVLAAAVAFRLFMFLVPYAFVMVTGFGLASTAASQSPNDAARSAGISGLLASAITSTSTLSLANRIVALPMTEPFEVLLADGISKLRGHSGDWLVDYGDGSLGIVSKAIFPTTYEIIG